MAFPVILFNNATGSDTAASGAGPATALTGTSASFSGSVVTLDGSPDLSGVATNGSHVLYLVTSTGRKFFTINAADNGADTVTLDDAPAGTSSGLSWAIGGKRKTLDDTNSRLLFSADAKAGWIAELEDAQSLTSTLTVNITGNTTDGYFTLRGSGAALKTITQTANDAVITTGSSVNYFKPQWLKLQNTNGTKTNADGIRHNQSSAILLVEFCEIGDATNTLQIGINRNSAGAPIIAIRGSYIHDCASHGASNIGGGSAAISVYSSVIVDNGGNGVLTSTTGAGGPSDLQFSIFARNGAYGAETELGSVSFCTFDNNTLSGLRVTAAASSSNVTNNIFSNNGAYGLIAASSIDFISLLDFNDFYNNTSGARSNASAGPNDLTLDPQFTDAANDDFSIGTNLKGKGFPGAGTMALGAGVTSSINYVDIGAVQRQEAASAGGGRRPRARYVGV